ncbi:DUF3093 domain-containing protein [Mycobacterium sp. Aquia_213]|uniref:DUF3093 domain-containing protein n=1 Tax=Mycobacterium sp. Aquia_213 TaxID=2991728 RepID=UPI00226EC090|nr:DUF3093 domain-containing protein [Mycobacterium sp. Aquia_213]WAC90942.1 DUF3093 domain-containing protein [Mycobacterium sp. Aquia_213]
MTTAGNGDPKPLFYEPGASWIWVLSGPAAAGSMILIEMWSGAAISLWVPAIFLVMVSAFISLQVKAARIHVSVELTADALRQGTETILVREIIKVFPEPEHAVNSGRALAKWQEARALGELFGVPRGRTAIGLKLTGGRTAQAWAKRHRRLREVLTPLVQERVEPARSDAADLDYNDDSESEL